MGMYYKGSPTELGRIADLLTEIRDLLKPAPEREEPCEELSDKAVTEINGAIAEISRGEGVICNSLEELYEKLDTPRASEPSLVEAVEAYNEWVNSMSFFDPTGFFDNNSVAMTRNRFNQFMRHNGHLSTALAAQKRKDEAVGEELKALREYYRRVSIAWKAHYWTLHEGNELELTLFGVTPKTDAALERLGGAK